MSIPKRPSLEFTDCESCGKRVATTAPLCRHCNTRRTVKGYSTANESAHSTTKRAAINESDSSENDDDEATDHYALGIGGYESDIDDDNDLNSDAENAKHPLTRLWWSVAFLLLCIFVLGAFLPLFFAP